MDVDGQAAVGDQLTTDGGICFALSDRVRWRMGALRHRGLVTDTRQCRSAAPPLSDSPRKFNVFQPPAAPFRILLEFSTFLRGIF